MRARASLVGSLLAVGLFAASSAQAAVSIDFSSYADGTAISSLQGVSFSLAGGPGPVGVPLVGLHQFGLGGLTNSSDCTTYNCYPTANVLDVKFNGLASGVSMFFNNQGTNESTFLTAYNGSTVLGTFALGGGSFAEGGTLDLPYAITEFTINNGAGGNSWVFELDRLSARSVASVPEPETYAMIMAGLGLLGFIGRGRKK